MYLWRQWQNGRTASKNYADVAYPSSVRRSLARFAPRDSGECQDTRRCNKHCEMPISIRSAFPE